MIGRNCRFLQGPQTDKAEVKRMRDAIAADPPRPVTVKLLNYRLDGQPFWNNLHVAPIRNSCGQVGHLDPHRDRNYKTWFDPTCYVLAFAGSQKMVAPAATGCQAGSLCNDLLHVVLVAVYFLSGDSARVKYVQSECAGFAVCTLQVMFFVGVQLDITAPPTKRSEVQQSAQSRFGPADSSASRHGINAASQAVDAPHEAQHSDAIVSPAAHQQVQSQVRLEFHFCSRLQEHQLWRSSLYAVVSVGYPLPFQ